MRVAGLEPARSRPRGILSPLRLPISPYPHAQSASENYIKQIYKKQESWLIPAVRLYPGYRI